MNGVFSSKQSQCFKTIGQLVMEKIFKGFCCIWVWQPYWSCDLDLLNKFSFPQPMEALHEIWLQLAKWILRNCLKLQKYQNLGSKVKE